MDNHNVFFHNFNAYLDYSICRNVQSKNNILIKLLPTRDTNMTFFSNNIQIEYIHRTFCTFFFLFREYF